METGESPNKLTDSDWDVTTCVLLLYRLHSCQPLSGVNLSPVFVNLYFPYAGQGLLFFAGGSIVNSNGMCGSGRKKQCCAKYTCTTSNLTSNEIS